MIPQSRSAAAPTCAHRGKLRAQSNAIRRVHTLLLATIWSLPVVGSGQAQRITIYDTPQSDRRVHYAFTVTLQPDGRTLVGIGRMLWRNPGAVAVDTLQMHLYLNAFVDEASTFMRERGGAPQWYNEEDGWGRIEFTRLQSGTGTDLLDRLRFLAPDDGNTRDRTVAALPLPAPVLPGDTMVLDVSFEARLPKILARTGVAEGADGQPYVMAAQWFPKFGVYEVPGQRYVPQDAPHGRWNTHQFHANSEFYADFGTYDITIDVPLGYVVGATGVRTSATEEQGRRLEHYVAADVHDFAWTASPAFEEYESSWRHVTMRLLLQPEHRGQAKRHLEAARVALEGLDRLVGVYPYTTLTLVDGLGASQGMEYPTLILCGTAYGMPSWVQMPELILIHEFGHQYFYGLLASNEFEEAWLDEGLTSYIEGKVMDDRYGAGSLVDFPGLRVGSEVAHRLMLIAGAPPRNALVTRSWEFAPSSEYSLVSYSKSATVMHTLEGVLGPTRMQAALKRYYADWRFRHPTTRDFQAVVEQVEGDDMAWFFDQYVYGTAAVDYALAALEVTERADGTWQATVRTERTQQGTIGQVIRVEFADGTAQDRHWDGVASDTTLTFTHTAMPLRATVDPDFEVVLDINRLNNSKAAQSSSALALKAGTRMTVWIQYALRIMESLF